MKRKFIAVVGRPNVGKSTFVNRISGKRRSIVDDMPGVTRDRIYFDEEWQGKKFTLIDTGGIIFEDTSDITKSIHAQAQIATEEADLILFLTDGIIGITPDDEAIANILRKSKKPVIVVVNKIDSYDKSLNAAEFYSLGFNDVYSISALHGSGVIGDLLDDITSDISRDETEEDSDKIKIAVVGKPNAGKSSIVNALCGQKRVIVSEESGTTRDSIDLQVEYAAKTFVIVDTAGIRKKSKVSYGIEAFAVDRAIRSIRECDVALLVIDSLEGISDQDKKISQIVIEAGKALVIAFNKWDLIKGEMTHKYEKKADEEAPFLSWVNKIFISAKTTKRLPQIFEQVEAAYEQYTKRVSTSILNKVLNEAILMNPPTSVSGKRLKLYYATQVKAKPPTFTMFINDEKLIKDSYKRYIEKRLREAFGFFSIPIRISFREKGEKKK